VELEVIRVIVNVDGELTCISLMNTDLEPNTLIFGVAIGVAVTAGAVIVP